MLSFPWGGNFRIPQRRASPMPRISLFLGRYLWRSCRRPLTSAVVFSLLGRSSTAVLLAFRPRGPCNLNKKRSWCGAGLRQDRPPRAPILGAPHPTAKSCGHKPYSTHHFGRIGVEQGVARHCGRGLYQAGPRRPVVDPRISLGRALARLSRLDCSSVSRF
jgi:hypothetical protein